MQAFCQHNWNLTKFTETTRKELNNLLY